MAGAVKSATTVPLGRAPVPVRELALTVSALGELEPLLDPVRWLRQTLGPGIAGWWAASRVPTRRAPGVTSPPASPALAAAPELTDTTARKARLPAFPAPATVETVIETRHSRAGSALSPRRAATWRFPSGTDLLALARRLLATARQPANMAFLIILTALITAWWVELRPTGFLGGPASFIVVRGTSMLPLLHTGDFVLGESQSSYRVGEIVIYKVPAGNVGDGDELIHRIVGGSATTGWVIQGVNNPHPDPWRVPNNDVMGTEFLVLPGAGGTMLVLRSPIFAGSVAGLIAVTLVLFPPGWLRRRRTGASASVAPQVEPGLTLTLATDVASPAGTTAVGEPPVPGRAIRDRIRSPEPDTPEATPATRTRTRGCGPATTTHVRRAAPATGVTPAKPAVLSTREVHPGHRTPSRTPAGSRRPAGS